MHQETLYEKKQEALMHAAVNVAKVVNAKVPPTTASVRRNKPPSEDAKVPEKTLQTPINSTRGTSHFSSWSFHQPDSQCPATNKYYLTHYFQGTVEL